MPAAARFDKSKEIGNAGLESDEEQKVGRHVDPESPRWAGAGGLRAGLFSNALGLLTGGIFLLSWFAQSIAGRAAYNQRQFAQRDMESSECLHLFLVKDRPY